MPRGVGRPRGAALVVAAVSTTVLVLYVLMVINVYKVTGEWHLNLASDAGRAGLWSGRWLFVGAVLLALAITAIRRRR